ncbi:hypothetical protein OAL01_03375 [Rubripirellula sp.]|nr:hypothetical protein [Rubripirellula sp.]
MKAFSDVVDSRAQEHLLSVELWQWESLRDKFNKVACDIVD